MRINLIISLLVGWWWALPSAEAQTPVVVCGVTFGFIVSPQHELTSFKLYLPPRCNDPEVNVELTAAWKKTACAHFSTTKLNPTYKEGEPPREKFDNYFYRPNRPDVLYPTVNAGSSKRDPVVYIQEAILETNSDAKPRVCDGDLDAQRPDAQRNADA